MSYQRGLVLTVHRFETGPPPPPITALHGGARQLSKMMVSLLLTFLTVVTVLPPSRGQESVIPSPGRRCSQDEVCATKTSCEYWLDRENNFKAGRDPTYLSEARANICNKEQRALCCPQDVDVESPTFIPKVQSILTK